MFNLVNCFVAVSNTLVSPVPEFTSAKGQVHHAELIVGRFNQLPVSSLLKFMGEFYRRRNSPVFITIVEFSFE